MFKKIKKSYVSIFSLIAYFGLQTANAMNENPDFDCDDRKISLTTPSINVPSLSLQSILGGLNNKNTLLERIRLYNPTKILKGISEDLQWTYQEEGKDAGAKQASELLLKGIFAIYFHGVMAGEIPSELKPFFEILTTIFPSRNKKKDPFLGIPGTSANQRVILLQYSNATNQPHKIDFRKNDLLDTFFLDTDQTLKIYKALISTNVGSFQKAIRSQFGLENNIPYVFGNNLIFENNLMESNRLLLVEWAALFGSSKALPPCFSYAETYFNQKDFKEAQKWYQIAVDLGEFTLLVKLGAAFYFQGNIDEAASCYRKASNQGDDVAMTSLGALLYGKGQKDEALKWWQEAEKKGNVVAMLERVRVKATIERADIEILLKRATDVNKIIELGKAFYFQEKMGEAELCFRKVANQNNSEGMLHLGSVLYKLGQKVEALRYWKKAANQGNVEAMIKAASVLYADNKIDDAEKLYEQAVKKDNVSAMTNLGVIKQQKGKKDEAAKLYKQAADRDDEISMVNLADILDERGERDEAAIWYKKAANKNNSHAQFKLGIILYHKGEKDEAKKLWQKAVDQGHVDAKVSLGDAYYMDGQIKQARQLWQEAEKRGRLDAAVKLGDSYYLEGDQSKSIEWYKKGADKGNPDAQFKLGIILYKKGEENEAQKLWQEAAKQGKLEAIVNLATILLNKNQDAEAKKWCQKGIELGDPYSMVNLGEIFFKNGEIAEAERCYQEALNKGCHEALLSLARLYALTKEFDKAGLYFKEAISAGVRDAEIHYAHFLFIANHKEEALKYLEFYEGNEGISSDEEKSFGDTENKSQPETFIGESDVVPVQTMPVNQPSQVFIQTVAPDSNHINEKRESTSEISKRLQRYIDRTNKREKTLRLQISNPFKQERKQKTYTDVTVSVLPEAHADVIGDDEIKIQGLVSSLANGECRGRFKALKGYNDVYSMRLTKGDRVVIKITGGDTKNGVTSLTIIAAKGHYKTLNLEAVSKTKAIAVKWSS